VVGGDWYDLFTTPTGALWVVAGDVAGHGLPAAVIMGRVRTALRAYALLDDNPARALELTDRKCKHFEFGTIITAVCAISTPPYRDWQIVSAGHLPPMIAASGRPSSLVELPVGPPLGVDPNFERSTATVTLDEGDLMLIYTDGLVERRGESIDAGIERLRTALRPAAPDEVCRQIIHDLVGPEMPNDDVVLVAIQRVLQG
jgi:serine phosphatase RsbU (regulator of sigma subunit)